MKKYIPAMCLVTAYPYAIVLILYCTFSDSPVAEFLMEVVFQNYAYYFLMALLVLWLVTVISAIVICVAGLRGNWDAVKLSRSNLLIKTIAIPAYLAIFVVGVLAMITIFTFAFTIALMILDVMAITSSGLIGVAAVKRSYDSGALSAGEMILHVILQFVFCADVISGIIVFSKTKKNQRQKNSQPAEKVV